MKLIPRYLLRHLIQPWVYILLGFSIVAILVDLFDHFVNFMEAGTPMGKILLYYAVLLPTYMPYMLPISLLLALLYALWQLGKNSEITAMRACGLSLRQLIRPYLTLGVLCSLLLFVLNEGFNPWAIRWTRQFSESQDATRGEDAHLVPVAYKNTTGHRIWRVNTFDVRPETSYEMKGINLTQQRPDGTVEYRMDVERARWMGEWWWFENADTHYFNRAGDPDGPGMLTPSAEMTMLSETPHDFLNEIKDSSERSTADILSFIRTHRDISPAAQNRLLVDFHYRLASPWLCIIVVLVGVPFGMQTGRRGMGVGILLALAIFFGYYVLMGLGLAWGKNQLISPVWAGWTPVGLFFALGLVLLRRIR